MFKLNDLADCDMRIFDWNYCSTTRGSLCPIDCHVGCVALDGPVCAYFVGDDEDKVKVRSIVSVMFFCGSAGSDFYLRLVSSVLTLVENMPIELLALVIASPSSKWWVAAMLRLNRVVRARHAVAYLSQTDVSSWIFLRRHKLPSFLVLLLLVIHIIGCLWVCTACTTAASRMFECSPNSWVELLSVNEQARATQWDIYLAAFYWSTVTTATVGLGDIYGTTTIEMPLASSAMLAGIMFYGYFIATIAGELANADFHKARFYDKLTLTLKQAENCLAPESLKQRIGNHFELAWQKNLGLDTDKLFDDLSPSLRTDLSLDLYLKAITSVPMFANKDANFTRLLSTVMQPMTVREGEYIVRKGEIGEEMFFLFQGQVDVVSEDARVVFASMHSGSFFGEISLLFRCPRTASIRAAVNCDLFTLTKAHLDKVLENFAEIEADIRAEADARYALVQERSKKPPNPPSSQPIQTKDSKSLLPRTISSLSL